MSLFLAVLFQACLILNTPQRTGDTALPEGNTVWVFLDTECPKGEVLYRGAIDNWYHALGKNRPAPTEHYLKNALDAVLNNTPILTQRTEAVGCLMNR